MPAFDQANAVMILNAQAAAASWTATVLPVKCRLMISTPTASVAGTELSATGYTAGGLPITFGSATGTLTGAIVYNTNSLSWTNSGSAVWPLPGFELWDTTPRRLAYGIWDDGPLSVGPGSPFSVAIGAVGWQVP